LLATEPQSACCRGPHLLPRPTPPPSAPPPVKPRLLGCPALPPGQEAGPRAGRAAGGFHASVPGPGSVSGLALLLQAAGWGPAGCVQWGRCARRRDSPPALSRTKKAHQDPSRSHAWQARHSDASVTVLCPLPHPAGPPRGEGSARQGAGGQQRRCQGHTGPRSKGDQRGSSPPHSLSRAHVAAPALRLLSRQSP
jgi:hypothetical protein